MAERSGREMNETPRKQLCVGTDCVYVSTHACVTCVKYARSECTSLDVYFTALHLKAEVTR